MKTTNFVRLVSLVLVFIFMITLSAPATAHGISSDVYSLSHANCSVIFKSEEGGMFEGDVISSSYKNLPYGSKFPTIPEVIAYENYEFLGWYDENGNKIDSFPETVTQDYVFIAKWSNGKDENPVIQYVVKHYLEQLDGTYLEETSDTVTLSAELGATVSANPLGYENYTFNPSRSTSSSVVNLPTESDGNINFTTLSLYYDLNSATYKIEYYLQNTPQGEEYSLKDSQTFTDKIGKTITVTPNSYANYELNKSLSSLTGIVKNNLVLKVYYDLIITKPEPVITQYVVKHYLQQIDGSYKEMSEDTETLSATVGETVTAKVKTYTDYSFNSQKSTTSAIVTLPSGGDGNTNFTTLSLYYDLNSVTYKVEYYLQSSPESEEYFLKETQTFTDKIGAKVELTPKAYSKFELNKSLSTLTGTVQKDLVLKVYYDFEIIEPVSTKYIVKYYLQQSDGSYKESTSDTETHSANVGEKVSASVKNYNGFTFNSKKSVTSTIVSFPSGNSSSSFTTLRLYYDLYPIEYKIEHYLQDSQNSKEYSLHETETISANVGASASAKPKTYDGYEFNRYLSNITSTATEDLVLKLYYDLKAVNSDSLTAKYVVRHYLQQANGSYQEKFTDVDILYANIGEKVSAKPHEYKDYVFNSKKSITSGVVVDSESSTADNEPLTLYMYYDLKDDESSTKSSSGNAIIYILIFSIIVIALSVFIIRNKQAILDKLSQKREP